MLIRFCCLLLRLLPVSVLQAQGTLPDSNFLQTIFTNQVYINTQNNAGTFYIYDSITSKAHLLHTLDSLFLFSESEVNESYSKIALQTDTIPVNSINTWMNYYYNLNPNFGMKQLNPFYELGFRLQGKNSKTYAAITRSTLNDPQTAFLIIPGSGDNTVADFLTGNGYHNTFCQVKNQLRTRGDVFTYTRPLQDFRALRWKQKRLMCDYPNPNFTLSYLRDKDKLYGAHCIIELKAWLKYLQQHYQRVHILTLSHGGLYTLLTLRDAPADGVMISAGYTAAFGTVFFDPLNQGIAHNSQFFGNLTYQLLGDSVKNLIEKRNHDYLFSWETNVTLENSQQFTQNFLGPQPNVQYFYAYGPSHSFPPCVGFLPYFDSLHQKAKPVIREQSRNCLPPESQVLIRFSGRSPFQFDIYRNDSLYQSYSLANDSMLLTLTLAGNYQIRHVTDSLGKAGYNSEVYSFNPSDSLALQINSIQLDCPSASYLLHISVHGQPEWGMQWLSNGSLQNWQQIQQADTQLILPPGIHVLQQLQDASGCIRNFNDTFDLPLVGNFGEWIQEKIYRCDEQATRFTLKPAYHTAKRLYFQRNGIPDSVNLEHGQFFLTNGHYSFQSVRLGNDCLIPITFQDSLSEPVISISNWQTTFDCDSGRSVIRGSIQGKPPFTIYGLREQQAFSQSFTDSNLRLFINKGSTLIHTIYDQRGCIINPFYTVYTQDSLSSFSSDPPIFSCDSQKTQIPVHLSGTSPWTLLWEENGVQDSIEITTPNPFLFFENGTYQFQYIRDGNHCIIPLGDTYFWQDSLPYCTIIHNQINCQTHLQDIRFRCSGRAPYTLHYMKDGQMQQVNTTDTLLDISLSNGNYWFSHMTDSNLCSYSLNQFISIQIDTPQIAFIQRTFDCDSSKHAVQWHLQGNSPWTLLWEKNGVADSTEISDSNPSLFFENGTYLFQTLRDANHCMLPLSSTYSWQDSLPSCTIIFNQINCLTRLQEIQFRCSGRAPYTLHYMKDGQMQQVNTTDTLLDISLSNGNYWFSHMTDSNLCSYSLNQFVPVQNDTLSAEIISQGYDCDSNKFRIDWQFRGNGPWTLRYTQGTQIFEQFSTTNSCSSYLPNGNWVILALTDQTPCILPIQDSLTVNYVPLQVNTDSQYYDCSLQQMAVRYNLQGNPPFNLTYQKSGSPPTLHTVSALLSPYTLYLDTGNYILLQVEDSTYCQSAPLNQIVQHQLSPIALLNSTSSYDCDSARQRIDLTFNGSSPFTLAYQETGSINTQTAYSNNPAFSIWLTPGEWKLISLQDSLCSINLADTLQALYEPLTAAPLSTGVSCPVHQVVQPWVLSGGLKPYTLYYRYNGIPNALLTFSDTLNMLLPNGFYQFDSLSDQLGCMIPLFHALQAQYEDFHLDQIMQKYLCESDSTQLQFDLSHQQRVWLSYTKDGQPDTLVFTHSNLRIFSNGQYLFQILYDSVGCRDTINQFIEINEEPAGIVLSEAVPQCDSLKHQYQIDLKGKLPVQMYYFFHQSPQIKLLENASENWLVPEGTYYFSHISDANGCTDTLKRNDTLVGFFHGVNQIQLDRMKIRAAFGGNSYLWYYNKQFVDGGTSSSFDFAGYGDYSSILIDAAGCHHASDTLTVRDDQQLFLWPNPASTQVTLFVNRFFGKHWSWQLSDLNGRVLETGLSTRSLQPIQIDHLTPGLYQFFIRLASDGSSYHLRLQKE